MPTMAPPTQETDHKSRELDALFPPPAWAATVCAARDSAVPGFGPDGHEEWSRFLETGTDYASLGLCQSYTRDEGLITTAPIIRILEAGTIDAEQAINGPRYVLGKLIEDLQDMEARLPRVLTWVEDQNRRHNRVPDKPLPQLWHPAWEAES